MTMEPIAVSIQNVSKKFRLFNSPEDRLKEALHPFKKKYHKEFWALKDISFDVPKGETIGIIGRNGSGKSTLLQIICGVLQPTTGSVTVNGRISALLELGADFNPEFTGRENVLMKGIRTGLSKAETKKRLPEIEAFADIGEFIDYPLKTYSSGMFVRLAFATAINVDPDILVVDEVLSVGDAKFQHKCYQKFIKFQEADKTIILVTHDTNTIVKHCDCAFLLENGKILKDGNPNDVANYYYELIFTGITEKPGFTPELVEKNYKGFNIVQYMKKYYALSINLGDIDLTQTQQKDLIQYQDSGLCELGSSSEDVKHRIDQLININEDSPLEFDQSEFNKFLIGVPLTDNCVNRKSYNKNEVRFGDKRAEIVDYLTVCGDIYDPLNVRSGETIDIYLKTRFYQTVEVPMFGFSLKTLDGIVVYASNTRYSKTSIKPAKEYDLLIFKFSMRLDLHSGDHFIDLGVAEKLMDRDALMDVRYSIIHLFVQGKNRFDGLVELEAISEEISRKTIK